MKIRDVLILGILLGGLFFSEIVIKRFASDEEPKQEKAEAVREYYFNDATLTGSGLDGSTAYRLRAARIRSPIDSDEVDLENVSLDMSEDPENSWSLSADFGHIYDHGAQVVFRGNVVLAQQEAGDNALRIRTERLEYDPMMAVATTDEPVQIETLGKVLTSRGMTAYLMEDRLELQSNVHGRFEP